jgi:hypothetical protein
LGKAPRAWGRTNALGKDIKGLRGCRRSQGKGLQESRGRPPSLQKCPRLGDIPRSRRTCFKSLGIVSQDLPSADWREPGEIKNEYSTCRPDLRCHLLMLHLSQVNWNAVRLAQSTHACTCTENREEDARSRGKSLRKDAKSLGKRRQESGEGTLEPGERTPRAWGKDAKSLGKGHQESGERTLRAWRNDAKNLGEDAQHLGKGTGSLREDDSSLGKI